MWDLEDIICAQPDGLLVMPNQGATRNCQGLKTLDGLIMIFVVGGRF